MRIDPEIGFTSDVITDPDRFVGRRDLLQQAIRAVNSPLSLIGVYGKRGVGKSSLLRQLQQIALGDFTLLKRAGLAHEIPPRPRRYLTVYYSCDALIQNGEALLSRLCNDQNEEDGLLRLVPNEGKELTEFSRSKEVEAGSDLKVIRWGAKGIEESKYARTVPGDTVQTFRNFVQAVVSHQVVRRMKRDGLLILLDEFDVIRDKLGLGSLIKSLSSHQVKFAVCGIADDMNQLVSDHASVERLLEQGAVHVKPMVQTESMQILDRAEERFEGQLRFLREVKQKVVELSAGYPYFTQLIGKECVAKANELQTRTVDVTVFDAVLQAIKQGDCFPTLEAAYQRAIGASEDRQLLLHLLADQDEEHTLFDESIGRVLLKKVRRDAEDLDITYVDQLVPRLVDSSYGPALARLDERPGVYEFVSPVFRLYVRLRTF